MRTIIYDLFPEAYNSGGNFITKEGTVAELIIDTGMLLSSDFDKVIPPIQVLNKLLLSGSYPRSGEWTPFQLIMQEYDELVQFLISIPLPRPYRKSDNSWLSTKSIFSYYLFLPIF